MNELQRRGASSGIRVAQRDLEVAIERVAVRRPILASGGPVCFPVLKGKACAGQVEDKRDRREGRVVKKGDAGGLLKAGVTLLACDARPVDDGKRVRGRRSGAWRPGTRCAGGGSAA